jgi:hypothetical protein
MSKRMRVWFLCLGGVAVLALTTADVLAQRGGGGRGGAGGGRSAGHAAPSAPKHANAGPAMTRPSGGAGQAHSNVGGKPNIGKPGGGTPNISKPNVTNQGGGTPRPNIGAGTGKPNGGFERPTVGNQTPPKLGGDGPRVPGKNDRPKIGGDRPNVPGETDGPNLAARPGGGASSSQLNDFLGGGSQGIGRPDLGKEGRPNLGRNDRPDIGKGDLPKIGKDDPKVGKDNLPKVGDRGKETNINVGNVNVGNSVDYSKNQQAWVDNHHTTGNQVRVNAGNRYAGAYNNGAYRHGVVGGYPYYGGWNNRGAYYGWRPITYAAFGTFMGAAWVSAQPRFYAYGTGGNVYYENNVVYVDGQAAGTPEEYAAQSTALVASAPAQITDTEWLPLGTFALTREGVNDSQTMLELAVNKQGVLAGTYYNEATQVSRSLKGMLEQSSQRAAIGFADGKNTDVVLETGIQNLTQDEAPALLHQGKDRSGPVLLVRLRAPEEEQK